MQTVYVDLYFLINFSMDFLCLYLCARLLSERLSVLRGLIAAALGGIYANAVLLFPLGKGISLALDILACALICSVAFLKKREWRRILLYILVYTAVSVTLGGFMTALFYLFNRTGIFDFIKESDGDGISVWLFALLAVISAVITLLSGKGFTKKMSAKEAMLEITYGDSSVTLRGMTDSGNLLCEPLSGKPCIVADRRRLEKILPRTLMGLSEKDGIRRLELLCDEEKKRVVLIPSRTVSGSGLLVGIRMDRILIDVGDKKREADAIVAISELTDSEALVPSCLLI